ncbi:MAG TPA: DNA translocase FtsK [Treponema sp.]|nr:DNA translocase FtsK [Treponema sp.]
MDNANTQLKFRIVAVIAAVILAAFAALLALSLTAALFGLDFFPAGAGEFFARSYGILALLIPVYLAYAAFLLADPRWRPDRIFLLSASIIPFLTLAVGIAFIRDFEIRSQQFAFLDFAGKTGFSFVIVLVTILEVLVLQVLRNLLFNTNAASGKNPPRRQRPVFLPSPPPASDTPVDAPEAEFEEIEELPAIESFEKIDAIDNVYELPEIKTAIPDLIDDVDDVNNAGGENFIENISGNEDAEKNSGEENLDDEYSGGGDPDIDISDNGDSDHVTDSVERAIEEAEADAAVHSEQARKKNAPAHRSAKNYRSYKVPVEILNQYPDGEYWIIDDATKDAAMILKKTLEEFKIQAEVTGIRKGPVITMFEILPAPGVKLSRIVNLQDNIALRLAAASVRIVAPIPGKHAVGIEVPNAKRNIVSFREIIEGELIKEGRKTEIPVIMGKDITGEAQTIDLVQMPHLLIAGATGSGKSVCVNSMILSILYQRHPAECRLLLIDPKIVELKLYNDIPHLLTPVITEPKRAFQALQYCIYEMERRYACLDSVGVRDIRSYNKRIRDKNIAQENMPYIVVVIDEFADLMATTGKELESTVARLAAMSRAVGIHLVLATQRPSIDVITGLIKANIPSRIAFMVASKMDSRIIIDMVGAEKLLGRGDMLYAGAVDPFPVRMQGAFVSEEEVEAVVEYVKTLGKPDYIDDEIFYDDEEETEPSLFSDGDDPLYEKALEIVLQQGKASASYIQRRLKIGYNRAARLVEEMEQQGVVGPAQGSKPREVLRGF